MPFKKTHIYKQLEVHYSAMGRKWVVINKENKTNETFRGCLAMIETYPELLNLKPIEMAYNRSLDKIQIKKQLVVNKTIEPILVSSSNVRKTKEANTFICYYCDGSGISAFVKCPNCNGKGSIKVTAKGF